MSPTTIDLSGLKLVQVLSQMMYIWIESVPFIVGFFGGLMRTVQKNQIIYYIII